MKKRLEILERCDGIDALHRAMHLLCADFGAISRLDILPASHLGKRQALCFLRMDTLDQEEKMIRELGIGRFGGDLILVVDLMQREAANADVLFFNETGSLRASSAGAV